MTAAEDAEGIRSQVRARYSAIATTPTGCCGGSETSSCCPSPQEASSCCSSSETLPLGYSASDRAGIPEGADLGLGCGNPTALVPLREGNVVLDLGSGAGVDCFLAARQVGSTGRVIGVDMTPEMVSRARRLAQDAPAPNVEFRLGEIEHLPVADNSVDVVISNCVINLSPDKVQVYREAFRVLRPGGLLAVSDVVATRPIPEELRQDREVWSSCSSGAMPVDEVAQILRSLGFDDVSLGVPSAQLAPASLDSQGVLGIVPGSIRAVKRAR